MNIYFRMDGWVKSAVGPSVPGAQIYVCQQPANVAGLPPSPLANIFSDPNGLVPITQPILTDGFGHYDFYALAGVYTVVVGLGGIIQQYYPDQSLGGATPSSGGSTTGQIGSVVVSGVPSIGQVITATSPTTATWQTPILPTFEINSAPASSQLLQNLIAGSGMTIVDGGNGNITLSNNAPGVTPVAKYMIGAGLIVPPIYTVGGFYPSVDAAQDVMVVHFNWVNTLTFNTVSFAWGNAAASSNIGFAIYSDTGNLLWQSGALTLGSFTTGTTEATVPSYTLTPGSYYLATTADGNAGGPQIYGWSLNSATVGAGNALNHSLPIIGIATNTTSGAGAFPSTLGTINGVSQHSNTWSNPCIMFYKL